MKRFLLLNFILGSVLISCKQESIWDVPLMNLNGAEVNLQSCMARKKGVVLVFLAPDCPLSQYYTLPLRELSEKFRDQIAFTGIIPGKNSGKDEIMEYKQRYLIPFELLMDEELKLTRKLKATITPEVFLLNEKQEVIYSGAIDDAAVDLTVKRQVVRNHYLKDAVESMLSNQPVMVKKSKAVGCFIERRK